MANKNPFFSLKLTLNQQSNSETVSFNLPSELQDLTDFDNLEDFKKLHILNKEYHVADNRSFTVSQKDIDSFTNFYDYMFIEMARLKDSSIEMLLKLNASLDNANTYVDIYNEFPPFKEYLEQAQLDISKGIGFSFLECFKAQVLGISKQGYFNLFKEEFNFPDDIKNTKEVRAWIKDNCIDKDMAEQIYTDGSNEEANKALMTSLCFNNLIAENPLCTMSYEEFFNLSDNKRVSFDLYLDPKTLAHSKDFVSFSESIREYEAFAHESLQEAQRSIEYEEILSENFKNLEQEEEYDR